MAGEDPVDLIGGLTADTDTDDVNKADLRDYEKRRNIGLFTSCAEVRTLDLSGRTRIYAGTRFFRKDTDDLTPDDLTETTACIIDDDGNHWLPIEGERYDLVFSATGQIGDGEGLGLAFAPLDQPLTLLAGLPGSTWYAVDHAPAGSHVTTFKMSTNYGASWTTLFTATIASGQRVATFSLAADVTIPAGAIIRPYGPATHDASISTVGGVIAARR